MKKRCKINIILKMLLISAIISLSLLVAGWLVGSIFLMGLSIGFAGVSFIETVKAMEVGE